MKILPELLHSLKSVQAWVLGPQCVAVQTCDDLTEITSQLVIINTYLSTGKKRTLDEWMSYIKNPETVLEPGNERKKNIMSYLLGFWSEAL